jgi:dipeptidyl aminopeptidase/acylaminoacyl peptidase
MESTIVSLELLLKVPYVDSFEGYEVSPDGKTLAYASNPTGQWEIYLLPLDGSQPPRQVSRGAGGKLAPRWSPGGDRIAYVLDLDGGENYDIVTYNLETHAFLNLTPATPEALTTAFTWSPDGCWIAFSSDRTGIFESYRVPSQGGAVEKLASLPYPVFRLIWSPDGAWIAAVVEARGQDAYTYLLPVTGGEPLQIMFDGQAINARAPAWSPGGDRLVFSSDLSGSYNLGVYDLETRQVTWLPHDEQNKEMPSWSPDGRQIAYTAGFGPKNTLEIHDLRSQQVTTYAAGYGVHNRPLFVPGSNALVFAYNDPCHPDDLWSLDLDSGRMQQLTHSLPPSLSETPFVFPQEITYPSLDGRDVPALLYRPHQPANGLPAVVYIHGGPNWLSQVTWDALLQHMLSRGWVVLVPNYRGSTGYGRPWQLANRFDFGGKDTQDIVAGAQYLVRAAVAHPRRIAVTGRSYGGYLTMTSLTQYPDQWVAGSAVVPFINFFTGHKNSRQDLRHWDLENFGDPEKDYDLYYQRSPYFFLDKVQAPVQLICGAHDPRCPASESLQAHDKLIELGKICDLQLYPDEGHSFLKTENVLDHKRRLVEFLATYLEA